MSAKSELYNLKRGIHLSKMTAEEQRMMTHTLLDDPNLRLITTKLVMDNKMSNRQIGKLGDNIPIGVVSSLASKTMTDVSDIRAITRALPEIETAKEILTAATLSPHDGVTEELTWNLTGAFPASLGSKLLGIVKSHFEEEYQINDNLSKYLDNALFDRGSHILAILPESSIDDIINSRTEASLESYNSRINTGYGIFGKGIIQKSVESGGGKKITPSLESYYRTPDSRINSDIIPGLLSITDNFDKVKFSRYMSMIKRRDVAKSYFTPSNESIIFDIDGDEEKDKVLPVNDFYRKITERRHNQIVSMNDRNNSSRKSIGHPLVVEPPHESCIPVFSPGNPEEHLGYLFLLDESGNFITYLSEDIKLEQFGDMDKTVESNGISVKTTGVFSQTLNELSNLTMGKPCDCQAMTLNELMDFYGKMIERDIKSRFNDAAYGNHVQFNTPTEVYRIMLARALSGTSTQILYLPATLVSYFAIYYNDFGIGESLVTRNKYQAGMRIGLTYANGVALTKNAVGTNKLKIQLDEGIQNIEEYVTGVVDRVVQANSPAALFHQYDPEHLAKTLYQSSLMVMVEGNEALDQTQVDMEYQAGDRPLVDTDFLEHNKSQFLDGLQIPAKLFDDSAEVQFSSEFTTNNILFMKRNRRRAVAFNAFIKDFVMKYTLHDGDLISEMSKVIREMHTHIPEDILKEAKEAKSTIPVIEEFLLSLDIGVPLAETASDQTTGKAFDEYTSKVDKYLQHLVESQFMEYFISEEDPQKKQEAIRALSELLKHVFAEDWIRRNNAFPEFEDLLFSDGKFNPEQLRAILDMKQEVANSVGTIINTYYERANPPEGEGDDTSTTDTSSEPAPSGEGDDFNTDESDTEPDTEEDSGDDEPDTEDDNDDDENKDDENESEDKSEDDSDGDDSGDGDDDDGLGEIAKI